MTIFAQYNRSTNMIEIMDSELVGGELLFHIDENNAIKLRDSLDAILKTNYKYDR